MTVKKMTMMAVLTTLLLIQEQALSFIPNVQLSTLLILLFASTFKLRDSLLMLAVYVVIDSLYMGALNPFYMIPMYLGWATLPVLYHTFIKRHESTYVMATLGFIGGFIYGVIFMPFAVIQTGVDPRVYLLADFPFQLVMASSNFITILWLYAPLKKIYGQFIATDITS
jgi:uncharacterized membrane protein